VPSSASERDSIGDVRGPAYGDITLVRAQISGRDLLLSMELAAAPPRDGRASDYIFLVDVDRDDSDDFRLLLLYPREGQLRPSLSREESTSRGGGFPGTAVISEGTVRVRIALADLGSPSIVGVQAAAHVQARDNAPDAGWLRVGR
jgi:hypothetical protein